MGTEGRTFRLNLGSGGRPLAGFWNLDVKQGDSIFPVHAAGDGARRLDAAEIAGEIRASHVLEHFSFKQTQAILDHWVSKLVPTGVLKIAVPDFRRIAERYLAGLEPDAFVEVYVMGSQADEYDVHRAIFDEAGLRRSMTEAGLVDLRPWVSEIPDCASLQISLNLMGTKPKGVDCG